MPLEEKMKTHMTKADGGVRGYIAMYEQGDYGLDETDIRENVEETTPGDAKEVFSIGTVLPKDHPDYAPALFAANIWPTHNTTFQPTIQTYWDQLQLLAKDMFSLFALCLNLPRNYFDEQITRPMNSLNMNHYPPFNYGSADNPWHESQLGIGAHTDYECFTLLSQQKISGLQVLNKNKEWENVAPLENAYVVNIGDLMARWSNGLFRSTVHRVRNHPTEHRLSMAGFCCCNYTTIIKNLVADQKPKYKEVVAGEHMLQRIEKANHLIEKHTAQ